MFGDDINLSQRINHSAFSRHVTAGDTTRWQLESVQGAAGPEGIAAGDDTRTFVLLKPNKPECETNLVVVTDRRVYQLDLKSVGQPVYPTQIR